jgi:1-acyl-sn-glycerol-3-phosphate acyltransferase
MSLAPTDATPAKPPAPRAVPASAPPAPPTDRWTVPAVAKVLAIALASLPALPLQWLVLRFAPERSHHIPQLFHRVVCRVLGVRITVTGAPPAPHEGGLIAANHVSWLDIPVISAHVPVSFVAKSEIAGWPVIGVLARLQQTLFIDRSRRAATADVAADMGRRLGQGDRIVLFGEGTTGDGSRILPFRTSLFAAVREALAEREEAEITVRPLAVLYIGRHGIPGGRAGRAQLAWYGAMELGPHLRSVLAGGPIDVRLVWGEPIRLGHGASRKTVARQAEAAIRLAAIEHFSGRRRDEPVPREAG